MRKIAMIRIALWGLVVIVGVGAVALAVNWYRTETLGPFATPGTPAVTIGGPFALTGTDGKRVADTDFAGRPRVMFFGFTYCPDVCPTTLTEMDGWLQTLGAEADRLAVMFISVDPERDTPEQLKWFLSSFDRRIMGLTGTRAEIDPVLKAFRVYVKKVPLDDEGDYTMDHTASVYLLDGSGRFVGTISYQEAPENALAKLKRLLDAG